jgi:Membrane protein implicated in regulation of membrane protease activity
MTGYTGAIVWLLLALAFFVIEGMTTQFVSLWFAFGAIVVIPFAAMGVGLAAQMLVFLVASLAFFVILRPIVRNRIQPHKQATNADMVIGQTAVVVQEIDNLQQTGRARVNNLLWTARTAHDNQRIAKGERVLVMHIDGVKLIVTPISAAATPETENADR